MDARKLYEDLGNHSTAVGAYTFVSEEEERKFRFHDRNSRVADIYEIIGDPDNLSPDDDRGSLTFRVPSPWHAVIHLLANSRDWLAGGVLFGRSSALIYRGQGNVGWTLVPSIYRDGVDFERQRDVLYAFVNILERFFRYESFTNYVAPSLMLLGAEPVEKVIHVAAGQHYGIRTQLLDFTTDPAVAVWFACQSASRNESHEAAVFALPTRLAPAVNAVGLFPHPYVTRIYRQRGVFVQVGGPRGGLSPRGLRQLCVEIRFPPDPQFRVIRDGQEPDLLEGDPFWPRCVELANDIVERGELDSLIKAGDDYDGNLAAMAMLADFPGYPEVAHAQKKPAHLRAMTRDLLQTLLSLSICFDGPHPRVLNHAIRWLTGSCRRPLMGMYPLLYRELSLLPETAPTRQAGMMLLESLRANLGDSDVYGYHVPY
jgi:hypothetical protein